MENIISNITYDEIIQALKAAHTFYEPDQSLVAEAKYRIHKWAIRNELEARTSIYTDDHVLHKKVVIDELVKYLEPKPPYSGGFSINTDWSEYDGGFSWHDRDWDVED